MSLVEKVARVVCCPYGCLYGRGHAQACLSRSYENQARAAIEAMREPTSNSAWYTKTKDYSEPGY